MGTEVHCNDINEDSNSCSWPLVYGEKSLTNVHYYNNFIPKTVVDANSGCDKDALKQRMLEHEAIFKNQVYELHRLYRIQSDMMEEVKRNAYHKQRISIDTSSSSSLLPSQGNNNKNNNNSLKDCEIMESRPSKVRKKLFNLELPPDDNIDHELEDHGEIQFKQAYEESTYKDTSSRQCLKGSSGLVDLNEPVNVDEPIVHGSIDDLGPFAKPKGSPFLGPNRDLFEKSQSGAFNPLSHEGGNGRCWLSNARETGNSISNMNFTQGAYSGISTKVQDNYRFTPTPIPAFCTSTSSPYMNPTDFGDSWLKPNGGLTNMLTSFKKQPAFLPSQSRMNGCYTPNGFYHGSSSGSKDPSALFPSALHHQNYNNLDDKSRKIFKGSNFIDLTDTSKGIDLNSDNNSSKRCDKTVLPWLQPKPNINNISRCDDHVKKDEFLGKNEKILGNPVFGVSCISRNDSSSLMSTSASLRCSHENGKIKTENEIRGFDMNIAWDDHEYKQNDVEDCNIGEKVKNNFDLNSCLTEDEDVLISESVKSSSEKVKKKITMEIDLEAPADPEDEEEDEEAIDEFKKIDNCDNEFLAKVAAESIVLMSEISSQQYQSQSSSEVALRSDENDHLLWFVEVIENAGFVSNERDEFEELTLKQELTKEEDYMPKPLASGFQETEESGLITGPTRPRRGQARRGRPKRDFQRDILPGLVTLSRNEVTEDLQIFGGLMRATGHSWNAGLARKNGTRGRRKSVTVAIESPPPAATPPPQSPLSEVVGWGKTTRRPRRPRCVAGASVAVPLT